MPRSPLPLPLVNISSLVQGFVRRFGLQLVRLDTLTALREGQEARRQMALLRALPAEDLNTLMSLLPFTRAEFLQDLFALAAAGYKHNGFFVEFGATDGIAGSNSYLLEQRFGWQGILAEPARVWHEQLKRNRKAQVSTHCVWRETGAELEFAESKVGALSTLGQYVDRDLHADRRKDTLRYKVRTITLADLLLQFNAPAEIDLLSIDTEGSEHEILEAFDFSRYRFNAIVCEHNFTPNREKVHRTLTKQGYVRVFEHLSEVDDWYVNGSNRLAGLGS